MMGNLLLIKLPTIEIDNYIKVRLKRTLSTTCIIAVWRQMIRVTYYRDW